MVLPYSVFILYYYNDDNDGHFSSHFQLLPLAQPCVAAGKIIIFHIHDFCGKWEVNLLGAAPTLALLLPLSPLVSTNSSVVLTKPHQLTEILIVQFQSTLY